MLNKNEVKSSEQSTVRNQEYIRPSNFAMLREELNEYEMVIERTPPMKKTQNIIYE